MSGGSGTSVQSLHGLLLNQDMRYFYQVQPPFLGKERWLRGEGDGYK